jgi:glycosyltransferase involved in cell wall biosynthesis
VVYEAHAVEWLLYGERGVLYGTGERPRPGKARRLRQREGRVWRGAAAFVSTTAGIRDSFAEAFGARTGARVVPNGCDVPPGRSPAPAGDGPPRVLYAGQLYPWKGVDVLLEAVSRVPEARLVVVGGLAGEPDLHRLQALAERLALGDRVEFKGTVPPAEVARELARAAVVAVPFLHTAMTERHTSPLKAFEAMAAGRTVVASDLPSTREVLRHGETAWLVPPGDPAGLADGLRRLLTDRALAERLAEAAFAEAPRYSWDARGRTLADILREVA